MKRYSQLSEYMPVGLIFILLINLTGCYIFKPVSVSELSKYPPDEYNYVIKGKGVPFLLENPKVSNGLLWGKADPEATFTHNKLIRIYPSPDYKIGITDTTNTVVIPLDRIAKIKKSQLSARYTAIALLAFLLHFLSWF